MEIVGKVGLDLQLRTSLLRITTTILCCMLVIPAQAADNEGVSDYAKALPTLQGNDDGEQNKNTNRCSTFFGKYDSFVPVPNLGDIYSVKVSDIIEVKLMQAYIKDFPTSQWFRADPSGSLAIVANVQELSPKGTQSPQDFSFSQASTTAGRLVYYSSDVRGQQILNLSQLPIYGPVTYNGRPLAITIHVFSLNVNSQQVSSMLKSLAQVGALAYPPASPVLSILETLGTTLVTSRQEADSVLTYRFMLVPSGSQLPGVDAGLLEYGNYVVRRLQDRTNFVDWNSLLYDSSNGLLYKKGAEKDGICRGTLAHKDDTFLSLQINRASDEVALDSRFGLDNLIAQLQLVDKTNAASIDAIAAQISTTAKSSQMTSIALAQLNQYCKGGDTSSTIKSQLSALIDSLPAALNPTKPASSTIPAPLPTPAPAATPAPQAAIGAGVRPAAGKAGTAVATSGTASATQPASGTAATTNAASSTTYTPVQLSKLMQQISQCAGANAGRVSIASFDATCVKQYLKLTTSTDACK